MKEIPAEILVYKERRRKKYSTPIQKLEIQKRLEKNPGNNFFGCCPNPFQVLSSRFFLPDYYYN